MRRADGVERNRQIVGEEIGRRGAVGMNAADFARGDENRVRPRPCHEAIDRIGIA